MYIRLCIHLKAFLAIIPQEQLTIPILRGSAPTFIAIPPTIPLVSNRQPPPFTGPSLRVCLPPTPIPCLFICPFHLQPSTASHEKVGKC